LLVTPLAALSLWAAGANSPVVVSAASAQVGVAPDSLATIYGSQLSTVTQAAGPPPWPTNLGGVQVVLVEDSAGQTRDASLIYVSPTQINLWIPAGAALGPGAVAFPVTGLPPGVAAALRVIPVTFQKVAPALFTADGGGSGVVAASAIRLILGLGVQFPVPVYTCVAGVCTAVPIDTGLDQPVYLSLYGTGIRGASALANVSVTIGTQTIPAIWAGPQPTIPGLDQVNVPLPLTLRGAGLVNVSVTVDGVTSNVGQLAVQ
jgi:uncharacterized protein (TIGR03437 family)